ncbi:AAA domain-containing protein [Pseudomonas sp. NA13]
MAANDLPPAIGHFDCYRDELKLFLATLSQSANLSGYVDACFALFARVQADGVETGMAPITGQWVAVPRQPGYATRALANVYEAIPNAPSIGALEQLIGAGRHRSAVQAGGMAAPQVTIRHVAMVDKATHLDKPDVNRGADPLNESQRRALHALGRLGEQVGVVAVSGPPGTGKTAMLRAMIANQWVLAAYDNREYCPVTFVCGATNQSVENVMGTFNGAVGRKHALARRWLDPTGKPLLGFTASAPSKAKGKPIAASSPRLRSGKSSCASWASGPPASSNRTKTVLRQPLLWRGTLKMPSASCQSCSMRCLALSRNIRSVMPRVLSISCRRVLRQRLRRRPSAST